jgi:hypothetical protein
MAVQVQIIRRGALIAGGALCCAVAGAGAQPWSNVPPPLQRVDPGTSDADPLRMSLREMQFDLRRPSGFDTVYRLDAAPGYSPRGTMFMRMDGGITAVFPHSVYQPTRTGLVAEIPAGTVFHIGGLPQELQPQERVMARLPGFVDLSLDARAPAGGRSPLPGDAAPTPPEIRSMWNDDDYRRHRVATLLSRSGEAEATRRPPPVNPRSR